MVSRGLMRSSRPEMAFMTADFLYAERTNMTSNIGKMDEDGISTAKFISKLYRPVHPNGA